MSASMVIRQLAVVAYISPQWRGPVDAAILALQQLQRGEGPHA
jgi:hypothetical protein